MLPIEPILPRLQALLASQNRAVLVAPPGAGKTTRVPLALLGSPLGAAGKIIVLEPRRLAARGAAGRMAAQLGEKVGETVGLRVRFDTRISKATRIEVVTEGVFTRMILSDPALEGVSAVLFDEFHERSLDADLGLAFACDSQSLLREDLRLLVMSATLDGAAIAQRLGGAEVIESEGRAFSIDTGHLGWSQDQSLDEQVARAVRRALSNEQGSVLAFLPGQGEILRTERRLIEMGLPADVELVSLYGALSSAEQDRAIRPAPEGRRKVVLATSIAETSLTIEGVRVVVDCGYARRPSFDPASGLTRLETVRVSRASADQRRGRAGRTEPGVCYRLWDEPQTRAFPAFNKPEILETDLGGVALSLAEWGAKDPGDLVLIDQPPRAAFAEARKLLVKLGALTPAFDLTDHGKALAALPLPPRLADMVVRGAAGGRGEAAAELAVLITERGIGGASPDLSERRSRLKSDRSARARESLSQAHKWAKAAKDAAKGKTGPPLSDALLIAHAFPERIAQARPEALGEYKLASGRGARLEGAEALARSKYLAVADLAGGGGRADRIVLAASLDPAELAAAFADLIETGETLEIDAAGKARVKRRTRIGELVLEERLVEKPDRAALGRALTQHVRETGLQRLSLDAESTTFLARIAFLREKEPQAWPDLSEETLLRAADTWLEPLLTEAGSLGALKSAEVRAALRNLLDWEALRRADHLAPERVSTPAGTSHAIDYGADGGPRVEVRVQALYGLKTHPSIFDGKVPLTLALTSPAHRPIQLTRDLPGFWAGSWKDVKSEMKGRYPKHPWPDDPANAAPTIRVKPRG